MPSRQHSSVQVSRSFDMGFWPDPAYCLWIANLGNRHIAFKEKLWYKTVASEIAKDIIAESEGLRVGMTYCDPAMAVHTGAAIKTIKDTFEDNGVPMDCSVNNRIYYAQAIHAALAEEVSPGVPRLQILSSGCPYLIRTLPLMKFDLRPGRELAMADHKHDHACVTLSYYLISHASDERKSFAQHNLPRWMRPRLPKKRY